MVQNKQLINDLHFTAQDQADYKKKGIRLVEKIFPLSTVEYLQTSVETNFKSTDHPQGVIDRFDRFSNEFANRDEFYKELAQVILSPLQQLTGHEMAVTQIAILELEVGKGKGFRWHFDEYSFSFVNIDSPGHTLWVPLNPIYTKKQRGGMVWVHQNDFSGESRLKQWEHYQMADLNHQAPGGLYEQAKYGQYQENHWSGEFDKIMLDSLQQECDMELGDALLFNRNTWHKSQEMLPNGPLKKRTSIIFRLVDIDSVITRTLFEKTIQRMKIEGTVPPNSFGHRLGAFKDGDTIRDAIEAGVSF
ncbi:MAG: hypothetical protein R3B93_07560 [Bacteroidia bacterium]